VHSCAPGILAATETGNSPILSYNVNWDQGIGDYVDLVGESSSFLPVDVDVDAGDWYDYTEENLIESTPYLFKIRASNKWGWGQYSATKEIIAAMVPDQPAMVETSIDDAADTTGGLKILWWAPHHRGEQVTNYTI